MIVVKVELWSANTKHKTELARMHICNTGEGTNDVADYVGTTFIGRTSEALDKFTVNRNAEVKDWPRLRHHVWKLVSKMLINMGY